MNKIFNHFSHILDDLIADSLFYQIYFQAPYTLSEDDVSIDDTLHLCTGIARGCLVDDEYDYVVKFGLFNNSDCEQELHIYRLAEQINMDRFFLPPTYLGVYRTSISTYDVNDINKCINWYDINEFYEQIDEIEANCEKKRVEIVLHLYAYPRANTDHILSHHTAEDVEIVEDSTSPLREYSLGVAAEFIADYGADAYEALTEFLECYGINDLHMGNIGTYNNHICILDYAGN